MAKRALVVISNKNQNIRITYNGYCVDKKIGLK